MTDVFDWYEEYRDKIYEDDRYTHRHVQMLDFFDDSMIDEDDLRHNIACLRKARRLSVALGEDLFTLWCDAFLGGELHSLGEYKKSREVLSDAVLRARKPIYANTPQQLIVHVYLATSFLMTDPIGFEKEIRELCQFVSKNKGECWEHESRALELIAFLEVERRDQKAAEAATEKLQEHVSVYFESGRHWLLSYNQAKVAMRNKDWDATIRYADEGMLDPDLSNEPKKSFHFLRACALAALGDKKAAKSLFRKGTNIRRDIPDADDYMFCAIYWIILGEPQTAIDLRISELKELKSKGRHWEQYKATVHLAQLYEAIGDTRNMNRWTRAAEKCLTNFRNPKAILAIDLHREFTLITSEFLRS